MLDLQQLCDREELRQLISTLAQAGDVQDMSVYTGCYTEDGRLELPMFVAEGRAGIQAALTSDPAERARRRVVRHHITSSTIALIDAGTASGRSYFIVYYGPGADHAGHYEDQFRKVGNVWQLAHRRVHFDWVSDRSMIASSRERRLALLERTEE